MKTHKLFITFSFVLVACLGIVFGIWLQSPSPQNEQLQVVNSELSVMTLSDYPVYDSLSSLTSAATLTVEGKVLSIQPNVAINISPNQKRDTIMEYTVLQVEISEVYNGNASAGSVIPVKYLLDAANTWPQFMIGTEGIFVLQTYESSTPASMLNPSQSFYDLTDGTYTTSGESDLIYDELLSESTNSVYAARNGSVSVSAEDVRDVFRTVTEQTP